MNNTIYKGDSIRIMEQMKLSGIKVDFSAFSPPFLSLYTYTNLSEDLGNVRSPNEFFMHLRFFTKALSHVIKEGRMTCIHLAQGVETKTSHGKIGLKDIRGAFIRIFEEYGFTYWGETVIDKDPQLVAIRNKTQQLMYGTLKKDALKCRPALTDVVLIFKQKGESEVPVKPVLNNEFDFKKWVETAHGVWYDITESDVLRLKDRNGKNKIAYKEGKDTNDEKHLTPTQIPFYERLIQLYSNPNEIVFDPFGGSGTAAYVSEKLGRNSIICELKETYQELNERAAKLGETERNYMMRTPTLF
jgi:hypothetical protein